MLNLNNPIPPIDYDLFGPAPRQTRKIQITGGYAARPGTGPTGKTCKQCQSYCLVDYHNKTFRKCELVKKNWTHGKGTDIKASSPACALFE